MTEIEISKRKIRNQGKCKVLDIGSFEFWICFGLVREGRFARFSDLGFIEASDVR